MISDVFLEIIPKKIFQTTQNNKCLPVNQVWVSQTSSFFITLAFSMLSQSWKKRRIHSSHNYWFPVSLVDRHNHSLHENLRVFLKTYVLIYFLQMFAFNFPWKTSKSFLMFLEGWKKKNRKKWVRMRTAARFLAFLKKLIENFIFCNLNFFFSITLEKLSKSAVIQQPKLLTFGKFSRHT